MQDDQLSSPPPPADQATLGSCAKDIFIVLMILILLAVGFAYYGEVRLKDYRIKGQLVKVISTMDPIKSAISKSYSKTGKTPQVKTIITRDNQGKPAPADWAALGFTTLPALPPEIDTLKIGPAGEIIAHLTNIREGINNTEVTSVASINSTALLWSYQCTSDDSLLKEFLKC